MISTSTTQLTLHTNTTHTDYLHTPRNLHCSRVHMFSLVEARDNHDSAATVPRGWDWALGIYVLAPGPGGLG